MSLAFEDCKVYISNVDSQSSAEGGIIVQVSFRTRFEATALLTLLVCT